MAYSQVRVTGVRMERKKGKDVNLMENKFINRKKKNQW